MVKEKICFRCHTLKPISEFYKHKGMSDGHLGKCKDCTRSDSKIADQKLRSTKHGTESERARHREKYYRLNYKDKYKPAPEYKAKMMKAYYSKYPEKYHAKLIAQRISVMDGFERHHWSYRKEDAKDIIQLSKSDHSILHRFMIYDQERMMYRDSKAGLLLDSKQSHLDLLKRLFSID